MFCLDAGVLSECKQCRPNYIVSVGTQGEQYHSKPWEEANVLGGGRRLGQVVPAYHITLLDSAESVARGKSRFAL